MNFASKTKYE
jgi:hypothetical protein